MGSTSLTRGTHRAPRASLKLIIKESQYKLSGAYTTLYGDARTAYPWLVLLIKLSYFMT
jgi:hypothetical protein